jgi:predicted nucleic acid-binding protein
MRVLFDTDVLLDLFLDRAGFAENAVALWDVNRQGQIEGYISSITPINLFYIDRKLKGAELARQAVERLLTAFQVCSADRALLQVALTLPLADYEDAVQLACALTHHFDAVITRNIEDYRNSPLPVLTPVEMLARLTGI